MLLGRVWWVRLFGLVVVEVLVLNLGVLRNGEFFLKMTFGELNI
jgi:hypothetical protein